MRVFLCDQCHHPVFFGSVQCLHCGSTLGFIPEQLDMAALEPAETTGTWQHRAAQSPLRYRLCAHAEQTGCNFTVAATDPEPLCASCRQTRWLPDLNDSANQRRWSQIEYAKRQLYYTLARLGLEPAAGQTGPLFELLEDRPGAPVLTGHREGTITLNVAEADDDERARRRLALHEPYRTLIGHLRHESGHYFWDLLVRNGGAIDAFRALFGDERQDYAAALQRHYARVFSPGDWQDQYVSTYATAHPWEDWAETWAHYLHMVDLLETAASYRTRLSVPPAQAQSAVQVQDPFGLPPPSFDTMVQEWAPLTLLLNSLNRSLGQQDAYPFAPSPGALAKLRFVHELIQSRAR
jgi:hypothetical protein